MKTARLTFLMAALLAASVFSESAMAQIRPRRSDIRKRMMMQQRTPQEQIGLRFGNDFTHEAYTAGAQFWLPAGLFWRFVPSVDYHFLDSKMQMTRWQFNGDLVFTPRPSGFIYFGGGLAVNYLMPDEGPNTTDFGGNAIVGLQTSTRKPMSFFVQGRWTFFDETEFALMGGINMQLR